MFSRPVALQIFSFIYIGIALSFPIQLMVAHGHEFSELDLVFSKLTALNYAIMGLSIANGLLMRNASRHLMWTLPLMIVAVGWNNYIVGTFGYDFSPMMTTVASLAFLTFSATAFARHAYDLIKHPEKRWWMRPRRVHAHLETVLFPFVGEDIKTKTYDLSESGLFLPMKDINMKLGDRTTLQIRLSQTLMLRAEAQVARISHEKRGSYPAGLGLQFVGLNRVQKGVLKELVDAY